MRNNSLLTQNMFSFKCNKICLFNSDNSRCDLLCSKLAQWLTSEQNENCFKRIRAGNRVHVPAFDSLMSVKKKKTEFAQKVSVFHSESELNVIFAALVSDSSSNCSQRRSEALKSRSSDFIHQKKTAGFLFSDHHLLICF